MGRIGFGEVNAVKGPNVKRFLAGEMSSIAEMMGRSGAQCVMSDRVVIGSESSNDGIARMIAINRGGTLA